MCDLCHVECGWEGGGDLFGNDVVGAAFVTFGAVEHVVSVDVMEFVAFTRDWVWDDWESDFSTGSDLEVYGWKSAGLVAL